MVNSVWILNLDMWSFDPTLTRNTKTHFTHTRTHRLRSLIRGHVILVYGDTHTHARTHSQRTRKISIYLIHSLHKILCICLNVLFVFVLASASDLRVNPRPACFVVPHLVATVNAEKNDARSSVRRDAGLSPGLSPGPERSEYTPDMAASRDRDGSRDAGGAKADASTSSTTAQAIREHSAGSAIICGVQWVLCVTHKHIMVHPIKVCWLELICKVEEMWMIGHAWMEQINQHDKRRRCTFCDSCFQP